MSGEDHDRWIVIPNWDKFQHYSDRDPLWIKVYTELNSNDDWCDLSDSERGLLVTVWIEYARSRGTLKVSRVPSKVGQRSRKGQLERLNQAGFIQLSASKPLALARSREREKILREEDARVPAREDRPKKSRNSKKPYTPRENVVPRDPAAAIETMIRNGVIADQVELEAELRATPLGGELETKLRGMLKPL